MQKITLLFFLFLGFSSTAQQCDKVLFEGRVYDTLRPQSFYNLMIINRTSGRGVFGQPNGSFSVYVENGDSLTISVKGYPAKNYIVKGDSNCRFVQKVYIDGKVEEFREVVIKPLKTLEQIKEEREALALRETRMVTGIEVMQSPITALYQAFSRTEKNKRWIAAQEYKDNQRAVVRELLRVYISYDLFEMDEDEFDDFTDFLNVNEDFLKTATEMELITFIKDKYEHYKLLKQNK